MSSVYVVFSNGTLPSVCREKTVDSEKDWDVWSFTEDVFGQSFF